MEVFVLAAVAAVAERLQRRGLVHGRLVAVAAAPSRSAAELSVHQVDVSVVALLLETFPWHDRELDPSSW